MPCFFFQAPVEEAFSNTVVPAVRVDVSLINEKEK